MGPSIRKPAAQTSVHIHTSNIPKLRYIMPNPKTPLSKAVLTGAAAKNPQRFRDRSEPKTSGQPIGKAPKHLGKTASTVWRELAGDLGWLEREDRVALELTSVALGQVRDCLALGEPVTASLLAAANTALGKLGACPADRSKVQVAPAEDDFDPFAAFEKRA